MIWRSRVVIVLVVFATFLAVPTAVQAQEGRAWRSWIHRLSGPGTSGNGVRFSWCLLRVDPDPSLRREDVPYFVKVCRDDPFTLSKDSDGKTLCKLKRTGVYFRGAYSSSSGQGERANNIEFTRTFWEPAIQAGFASPFDSPVSNNWCCRLHVSVAVGIGFHSFSGPGVDFDRRSADFDLDARWYVFSSANWSFFVEGGGTLYRFSEAITLEDFGGRQDDVAGGEWAVGYGWSVGIYIK